MPPSAAVPAAPPEPSLGDLVLRGAVAAGVTAVIGVMVLSGFGGVRQIPSIFLLVASAVAFGAVVRPGLVRPAPRSALTRSERVIVGCLAVIALLTLVVAVWAAPNTWDSMTYHLARVAEWADHGSVAFYRTRIDRQLWQPPFAEYFVLLGYGALGRRDYLANLPQWLAGVGAVLAGARIARLLGASRRSQLVTALWIATIPAVILQATSTQNDLLVALWLSIALYFALDAFIRPETGLRAAPWFGAALALAIGTKGTALLLVVPLIGLFLARSLAARRWAEGLRQAGLTVAMLLAIDGSHLVDNLQTFGNPFGPASVQRLLRPASLAPIPLLSNLVTNASLQLGTPFPEANEWLTDVIGSAHRAAGADLDALYPYFGGWRIVPWSTHEDRAGNPVHWIMAVAGLVLALVTWRRLRPAERAAVLVLLVGLLSFAAGVRWQPFNSRLQTPFFVLAPSAFFLLVQQRWPRASVAALVVAVLLAIPPLVVNATRPILTPASIGWRENPTRSVFRAPRASQYFAGRPALEQPYHRIIEAIDRLGCGRVGLETGYDSWEYPLWALGRPTDLSFVHQPPADATARPGDPPPACAVVGIDQAPSWRPADVPAGAVPVNAARGISLWR